jgi:stearoyl-CoA desaturase (delta-9 desaturase)
LIEPRLAENRFYGWLEKTWMAQQIPWAVLFYALGGWGFIFWGVCARVTAGVLGHWLIGYFAHNRGAMHYEVGNAAVQGHNIPLTSVLTMGECWHNNHHAFPGSARLGLFPGEWDPGWWMLLLFHRLGLTWNFRLPEHLPMRAELHCLDKRAAAHFQEARFSRAGSAPQNPGLRQIWHRLRSQPTAKDLGDAATDLRIEWPAALLSLPRMRCLVGRQIDLRVNFALDRLVLYEGATPTLGLPGLCIAMARRNEAARTVALCLLPFAAAMETARSSLAVR